MLSFTRAYLAEAAASLEAIDPAAIDAIVEIIATARETRRTPSTTFARSPT